MNRPYDHAETFDGIRRERPPCRSPDAAGIGIPAASRRWDVEDAVPYDFTKLCNRIRRGGALTRPPPQRGGKIPSPGGRVARVSGSGEECGRKSESPHNITDLLQGRSLWLGVGLCIFKIVTLPPAFLFSHQSVPKSRLATASPRGKRFGAARRNAGDGVPYGVGGAGIAGASCGTVDARSLHCPPVGRKGSGYPQIILHSALCTLH